MRLGAAVAALLMAPWMLAEASASSQFQGNWCSNPCGSIRRPATLPCEFVITHDSIRWRLQWRAFIRHYELVAREPGKDTLVVRGGEADWYDPDLAKGAKYKIELVGNQERAQVIDYKYIGPADSWRQQGSWFITRCERTPNPYDPEQEYEPEPESDADS